ncbi:uncharacterized protein LOC117639912 isoform X2 [Thrips palmi]|uniref:Uncharacterized protein LOC117639912 isoform X2 n=1 Tax=Thrips palmi TaxID=161013 RepID=A0A6P8ZHH2_THRPL|nr:uncharacterized protein LOC117639912 isoform X2 [Thrips palmi]
MECPVCTHPWDFEERRPKGLPCLHSVCDSCLLHLPNDLCPQCRKPFTMPVPDNFSMVECLEALNGIALNSRGSEDPQRLRGSWWCMGCQSPPTALCSEHHDVRRPKAALQGSLQDWMQRASRDLGEAIQELPDAAAFNTLELLRALPATCTMTLRQDGGKGHAAEWRVDGSAAEDSLLKALIVGLAASGRLDRDPMGARARMPPAAQPQAPPPDEGRIVLNLSLSATDRSCRVDEKAETLQQVRDHGVRRMTGVVGHKDPAWVLDVLRSAAPSLQQLRILNPVRDHLLLVHAMPRLEKLELRCTNRALFTDPPVLPALFEPSTVRWLHVGGLPRATTLSLLRAHHASLKVLWLDVGLEPAAEWPFGCSDLVDFVRQCGLDIRELVIGREWLDRYGIRHDRTKCRAQLQLLERSLPDCLVSCDDCDIPII